jgi:alkanesulfonate monooxygenase SsuD/methylene tetrahydromethanopterin reductase-like flavin-dependent oxidoreductase (luciferase family)
MRLLEEICMLDQLSRGRLELGISRGSTGEHIENNPEKARAMFNEALNVLLVGLSTGEIDYRGQHFTLERAFTRLRPAQKPYPPLWYPTSNADSIPWIARHGINTAFAVHLASSFDQTASMIRRYRAELEAHRAADGRLNGHVATPKYGFSVHIHVAQSDLLARERAQPAFERFMHNFTYRFTRRGVPNRYADRANFADELERGRVVVGSPETVTRQLGDYLERSGANYVLGVFAFGSLPLDQTLESMTLFAREVMPALASAAVRACAAIRPGAATSRA